MVLTKGILLAWIDVRLFRETGGKCRQDNKEEHLHHFDRVEIMMKLLIAAGHSMFLRVEGDGERRRRRGIIPCLYCKARQELPLVQF